MNVVTLIGNLATEVELREVAPDKRVASFVLAVDRASRNGGADFVTVSAWDRQGELCVEYLGKGRRVAIDGRLKSRSWEEDGKRRSALEVVARRVEFLGGGPRQTRRAPEQTSSRSRRRPPRASSLFRRQTFAVRHQRGIFFGNGFF